MISKKDIGAALSSLSAKLDLEISVGKSSYHMNVSISNGNLIVNEINHEKVDLNNPEHQKEIADIFTNFGAGIGDGLKELQNRGIVEPDESDDDAAE